MASLALALHFVLAGPPGEVIAPPTQPGEPAIAAAELPGEAAASEPTVQRPGQPEGELPSYDQPDTTDTTDPADPVDPPPTPPGPSESPSENEALPTWSEQPVGAPIEDPWAAPRAEPSKLPGEPRRGVGLLAGAGVGFAVVFTKQWISELVCTDVYCGYRGNIDRLFMLGSVALIGGGAWMEGRHRGFMRHHEGLPARRLLGRRAAGWTLFSLGMVGMIAEAGMTMACYDGARGPFFEQSGFVYTCRPTASVLLMDGSATLAAVGFGLGMSAEGERKQARTGAPKLTLLPFADRQRAGLALVGRF